MKKLLVYLKGYEKETVLAPLFKMLEALFELFVPLVMAAVIDVGIGGHDRGYVIRMCLVLIALGVIGLACSITAQYFAAKAATGFSTVLRRELFAHIQSLSYTEMDNLGTSTLITRMTSDINQVQSGVNLVLRLFLRSPFIVFGAMIMAFTVDVKAAMIFVVAIPMLSVVVFGIMIWTMPLYRRVQGALDKVLGLTRENLTGVRVIRAFCLEERGKDFRSYESADIYHCKWSSCSASVHRSHPRGSGDYYHGSSGGTGQLYESDPGGAGEAGKSDHQHYQIRCLRKSYSECAGDSVQYEKWIRHQSCQGRRGCL